MCPGCTSNSESGNDVGSGSMRGEEGVGFALWVFTHTVHEGRCLTVEHQARRWIKEPRKEIRGKDYGGPAGTSKGEWESLEPQLSG